MLMIRKMDYDLLADEVLLRLMGNSDEKAFDAIFERYWMRIFISAYKKTGSKEIAEDLTQSLFATLWDKRNVASIDHLFRYLSVGIKNRVINAVNSEITRNNYEKKSIHEAAAEDIGTDHQVILKDLQNTIQQALSQLPEKTRDIFKLSKFENYSVKEIAAQFGITEKAVEYHITQSNKLVRAHLKEYLIFNLLLITISAA